jgi:hypothetical protein
MWQRLARSAAAMARRADISRLQTHLAGSLLQPHLLVAPTRAFASHSSARFEPRADDVKVRDVALRELVRRPWVELQEFYGPVEMSKMRQTLPLAWEALNKRAEVSTEVVQDFYEAAKICRLPKLQRDVFSYMESHYLERISFEMYGQMFNNLTMAKDPQRMRDIFARAMTRYDPEQGQTPPEIVYRLGISAAIALDDDVGMKTLMREMEGKGLKPSVEIVTRVLVAQALKGDVKTVLAAAAKLNPQDERHWHEADVNRVITSLGIAGDPDAAFDFYRRSQIRLSPKTMMKLMLVCRGNARPKHALAILANRRRFGLKMLPSQYPTLLDIIEELGIAGAPAGEMALMLQEMRDDGVQFTDHVHALIARNQHYLDGTPFMLTPFVSMQNDELDQLETETQSRTKDADAPLLRELLDARKFAQAAAIVDSYALPVSDDTKSGVGQHDPRFSAEEAIVVPPWLSDMAVAAYSQSQEIDKVRSLLRGFLCVRGDVRHALSRIVGLFGGKGKLRDSGMAYEAYLAMQFQEIQIFRVRDALTRFKQYQDTKAALALLNQVSKQIGEALQETNGIESAARRHEDFMRVLDRARVLNFDPARAVRDVVRIFLASKEFDLVVSGLTQLESSGVPTRAVDYENIFSFMSKANKNDNDVFSVDDFMLMWEDMARRNVAPSKAILRVVVPALCGNGGDSSSTEKLKRRQLAVIEGYHQAVKDRHDDYVLPAACFTTLLQAAAKSGSVEDVNAIHTGAVRSLAASRNKKHHSFIEHGKLLEMWNTIKSKKAAA